MPLYEFECDACGHRFERIQKYSDANPDTCPSCGQGPLQRLMSSPAIQFKGTGWYITDYARKGTSDSEGSKASGSKKDSKESKESAAATTSGSADSGAETKTAPAAPAATPAASTPAKT